jgi:hypothetical protein
MGILPMSSTPVRACGERPGWPLYSRAGRPCYDCPHYGRYLPPSMGRLAARQEFMPPRMYAVLV